MLSTILKIFKVIILHHEDVAKILKAIILELEGKSEAKQDLDNFKAETTTVKVNTTTGEVVE